ncbi:MAG: barstar family protein [Deltaproteobacteria bacterium]|nr:barstar family protein [Deltaproteobacteria bacterium]
MIVDGLSNIYYLNQSSDISDITAYAQENNVALFHVDGNRVINKDALLQKLRNAMRSPISHEQSWNKFRVDITDLSWIDPCNGFFLILENYIGLLKHSPKDWIIFLGILLDAIEFWKQTKTPLYVFFPNYKLKKDDGISLPDDAVPHQLASYISDIYFLNQAGDITEIAAFAQENNMEFFYLDGSKIKSKRNVLQVAGNTMRFPDYYGQNWDALNDCITDLNYWIAPRNGYILFYEGYENLLFSSPKEWIIFLEILLDAIEFYQRYKPPLYIFLQLSARNKMEKHIAELTTVKISDKQEPDSILANSEIFTQESYREFMVYINNLGQQLKHLHVAMSHYPKEKRFESPESDEWDNVRKKYKQTAKIYRLRLPLHTIAICPYCRISVVKPFDHFSLLGLYGHLNIDYTYEGMVNMYKRDDRYLGSHCVHALFTMQFVNFNGHAPDDLPIWAAKHLHLPSSYLLRSAPYVLVWPLIARRTSAVVQALPIGRYDDLEPQHHYTSYVVTYFTDGKNSNISNFWNTGKGTMPGPNLYGNIYKDYDLLKWIKVERLFWIDPDNTENIVNQPITDFPYVNIQPQGWYRIKEDRTIDGPHPEESKWIWSGKPPHHNQSFPKPIDV